MDAEAIPEPVVEGCYCTTATGSVFRYSFFHNIENHHRPRPQHHRPQINRQPKVQTSRRAQPNTSQTDTHEKHHTTIRTRNPFRSNLPSALPPPFSSAVINPYA